MGSGFIMCPLNSVIFTPLNNALRGRSIFIGMLLILIFKFKKGIKYNNYNYKELFNFTCFAYFFIENIIIILNHHHYYKSGESVDEFWQEFLSSY